MSRPYTAVVLPELSHQESGTVPKCPLPQETDYPHITSVSILNKGNVETDSDRMRQTLELSNFLIKKEGEMIYVHLLSSQNQSELKSS